MHHAHLSVLLLSPVGMRMAFQWCGPSFTPFCAKHRKENAPGVTVRLLSIKIFAFEPVVCSLLCGSAAWFDARVAVRLSDSDALAIMRQGIQLLTHEPNLIEVLLAHALPAIRLRLASR